MNASKAVSVFFALSLFAASAAAKPREKNVLRDFREGKTEDRIRLAPILGRMGDKKAADALLEALDVKHGNPRESAAIVDALGKSRDVRAVEPLAAAWDYLRSMTLQLGDLPANLQVLRVRILESLGRLGGEQAVAILSEAINDKDPRVVEEAVRGLGRLQVKAVVPALQQLVNSGGSLGQAVFEALGDIHDQRSISILEQALKGGDKFLEIEAAYALAKFGKKDMRQDMGVRLTAMLNNDPGEEKAGLLAAYYLARLDRSAGLDHLVKLMKKTDSGYAAMAAEALGKSENPRAILPLVEAARSDDSSLRLAVARSLGRLGGTRSVATLRKLCDDVNPGVRNAAVLALAELGEAD